MPDLDFAGLDRAAQAAFKPDFAEVRRRVRRRRRTRTAAVSLTALALVAAAATVGLRTGEPPVSLPGSDVTPTPAFIPSPGPSATASPGPRAGRTAHTGPMLPGDLDHFYLRWYDCHGEDCAMMVAATADRGTTWRTFPLPLPRNARFVVAAAGKQTLVAHYQYGTGTAVPIRQGWLASVDGGERWREVTPGTAARVPAGWRVVNHWLGYRFDEVVAADPVTGDVVLVPQTSGLEMPALAGDVPAGAGIWASGYERQRTTSGGRLVGQGSAVAVSRDGGRTWERHVFAGALTAGEDVALDVATSDGRTVYAVGRVGAALVVHRSADGGRTWRRAAGTVAVGERSVRASVRPDGTLVVQAGVVAGDRPLMFTSRDEGESLSPVRPAPGAAADPVPGAGGYVQQTWPHASGLWSSADGITWSYVSPPDLP
ncbi:sialidase family protein [Micromonospora sp. NPDC048170]|uniref:WD40/YVTN/BNR-like repeat-containing protein n=1 Tax=Micromonospora sp. NPDC048170 TaxID=3154819 RepID=UPI0033D5D60E